MERGGENMKERGWEGGEERGKKRKGKGGERGVENRKTKELTFETFPLIMEVLEKCFPRQDHGYCSTSCSRGCHVTLWACPPWGL